MSIKMTVDLSEFQRVWNEKVEAFKAAVLAGLREAGAIVESEMRIRAPYRSGGLESSIKTFVQPPQALITPLAPHAVFLERGTRASPGRYVPAIGKRLINPELPHFGMHPGIRATHFVEQTAYASQDSVQATFQRIFEELIA